MKNKKQSDENYLERCPIHPDGMNWTADENGIVTIDVENKGAMNHIMQKLIKKPKVSHIHLDEIGSFLWQLIDGEKKLSDMGVPLEEKFGEKAEPTYERLAQFFRLLEQYGFVSWKNSNSD